MQIRFYHSLIGTFLALSFFPAARASESFPTCDPVSEFLVDPTAVVFSDRSLSGSSSQVELSSGLQQDFFATPTIGFCAEWNPEFAFNGHRCCTIKRASSSRRRDRGKALAAGRCAWQRRKSSYCGERTESQILYAEQVASGKIEDPLLFLAERMDRVGVQAYCTVNNGFLANGRPLVPTARNRILLRNENRCLNFGTDRMIGMLEWVGRKIARQYPASEQDVKWVIGDISAPRGGCLAGRPGRRGHASHTSGQDVDVAFLNAKRPGISLVSYHREFDAEANWWLMKQVFRNPFACIRVVFLDRTLIRKLERVARGDPEWAALGRYIRHARGHANHFHIRVGTATGAPGCTLGTGDQDLEEFDDSEELDQDPAEGSPPGRGFTASADKKASGTVQQ